jgi:hypothetical protein
MFIGAGVLKFLRKRQLWNWIDVEILFIADATPKGLGKNTIFELGWRRGFFISGAAPRPQRATQFSNWVGVG